MNNLQTAVKDLLHAVGVIGDYPIKINRLDIAADLFGVEMKNQNIELWQSGWVGRSKVSGLFFNSRTGNLETINIGSRQSPIFVRVYDKVAQAIKEGDLEYWLDVWKEFQGSVTRIEWELKPSKGNFAKDLTDFSLFNGFTAIELLNYLIEWGRLCTPNPEDTNNRRWPVTPLWESITALVKEYSEGVDWPISRFGKEYHGMSEAYIKFIAGVMSGGMARFNFNDPNLYSLLDGLAKNGQGVEAMQRIATLKAAVISKL